MEIGRLCIKLAGRDAGRICVIIDDVDKNLVLVDGNVRRRKCNVLHLEPLDQVIKIKKGASHSEIVSEFKKLGIDSWNTKSKKKTERLKKKRKEFVKEKVEVKGKKR